MTANTAKDILAHAHAAWLGHLVQMEAERLAGALRAQDMNLEAAMNGIRMGESLSAM